MSQLLSTDHLQLLRFRLHQQHYGLNVHNIKEILPVSKTNKLPGASAFCLGVLSLRGHSIPCFDLSAALGYEPAQTEKGQYLVIDSESRPYALWVSAVDGIEHIRWEDLKTPPSTLKSDILQGIASCGDHLIKYLNISTLHRSLLN